MNNTPDILTDTRNFITRYVSLPDDAYADILALYVVHTHAFGAARTTPYIYINSAEKQSGKTRLLETLQAICHNAIISSDLSPASMFRVIEARRPCLMFDEVDAVWSGAKNEELRSIINSGYKHNGQVMRAVGNPNDEDGGIKSFSTWAPKILAGIDNGQMPDTIADRSITITLRRVARGTVDHFDSEDVEVESEELAERIRAWVAANMDKLSDRDARPAFIDEISDRGNDIARPLLYIAQNVPGWNKRARIALRHALGAEEIKLSQQGEALLAVRDYMDAHELDEISSAKVAEITGRSGKQIAVWFRAYDIRVSAQMLIDGKNSRGYRRVDFTDAWGRYLPATGNGE